MTKFLQSAGESMKSLPGTREEWWQYVYTYSPHRDVSITEKLFEDLLQAGLCDFESEGNTITDQPNPPTIAVLPFDNLSGDPEQEHFSDGLTASIILGLGMFNSLTVKSQQTSFAFKGSTRPSKEIAEELKVQYLVEGNVRKFKSQVRVTVQLVESGTGNQIWGRQYDSRLEDILELDQELSQTIAATISGRLGHKIQHSATQKPDQNLSNFDYLNRGLDHLGKFTPGDLKMAREQFQQCINIDPGNAVAHVNLAMTHMMDLYECWSTDKEQTRILSGQHMEKALEFAPDSAVIHAYLSDYLVSVREYDRAEFHADKAIELNPTAAEGYAVKADLLTLAGRSEEALKYAEQCFQLDPHSTGSAWAAGVVYRDNGQYQQAIKAFRSIHHIPNSVRGQIAACLAGLNQIDQAKSEMARYHEIAREQMPNYPNTREEWRDTWYETTPYQHDDDFDTLFQLLLKAGLCD